MQTIVVIEDDSLLRQNLATFLDIENYKVHTAENGEVGVALVKKVVPDLIICDISMPKMDGYDVYYALRKEENLANVPFIFLTARTLSEDIRRGMNIGVDDYLTKPFSLDDLLKVIKTRINKANRITKVNDSNYRMMIENALTGTFLIQNNQFVFVNSKFTEITGYTLEEVLDKNLCELLQMKECSLDLDVNRCIKEREVFDKEVVLIDKDGNKKDLEIYGGYIRYDNKDSFIGSMLDISEKKNYSRLVKESMILVEEEQRKHFAAELHDGLAPLLFGLKLHVDTLIKKSDDTNLDLIKSINEMAVLAIDTTKEIARNITPSVLENYGLAVAVSRFIESINLSEKIKIDYKTNIGERKIKPSYEIVLYRIITELIHNTFKYAQANNIGLELKVENNSITLSYSDDGIGISSDDFLKGQGIRSIIGRVRTVEGRIDISSNANNGIKVFICLEGTI